MGKFATGKRSQAISDRSGMAFPYTEMVKEWNGSLVHISEFESKHPQIRPKHNSADAIALQNTRAQRFQRPTTISAINPQAPNDKTVASSGGASMTTVNLNLPGNLAFQTEKNTFNNQGFTTTVSSMFPENGSSENRKREVIITLNNVTVSIT